LSGQKALQDVPVGWGQLAGGASYRVLLYRVLWGLLSFKEGCMSVEADLVKETFGHLAAKDLEIMIQGLKELLESKRG
jgi:hypothetical protein